MEFHRQLQPIPFDGWLVVESPPFVTHFALVGVARPPGEPFSPPHPPLTLVETSQSAQTEPRRWRGIF